MSALVVAIQRGSTMTLVAGIDSSTQACKVTVRDIASGRVVREGKASHPSGTITNPEAWWHALLTAVRRAGGLEDVAAISVSGQDHTPVFLDDRGSVICDSPLWNDTGSHAQTVALNEELGKDEWIRRTGLPITLSDTVSKLRWLRDGQPLAAKRTAAVAVVKDWLTWRLLGFGPHNPRLDRLTTDRSEAGGTGYWDGETGEWCDDLFSLALGHGTVMPKILGPLDSPGVTGVGLPGIRAGVPLGPGAGDNAAAALALGINEGDVVMSLGTSGVVYTRSAHAVHDYEGYVCSYADATGAHLPLVATLNAARNFEVGASMLGCSHEEFAHLALGASPGAEGLTMLPFFQGERTPDLPDARGSLLGATLTNFTRPNLARAVVEGTLASQVAMLQFLRIADVRTKRLLLIGGAAQNLAVQSILGQMVEVPVAVPAIDEYVTKGAAMQAVGVLDGGFPSWASPAHELQQANYEPQIMEQHLAGMVSMGYEDPRALDRPMVRIA